jgi:hypothetical protein
MMEPCPSPKGSQRQEMGAQPQIEKKSLIWGWTSQKKRGDKMTWYHHYLYYKELLKLCVATLSIGHRIFDWLKQTCAMYQLPIYGSFHGWN